MESDELEKELYDEHTGNPYVKMGSLVGGVIFSGIGYTVTATGYLVKDLLYSLSCELPTICGQLMDGAFNEVPQYVSDIVMESLYNANQLGGAGAAVGMLGGTIFFGRMRDAIYSVLKR